MGKNASYLPGRTDNDVKNFWSTRQKRLARILKTPTQGKSHKSNAKNPALESSRVTIDGKPPLKRDSCHHISSGGTEEIKMIHLPNLMNSNLHDHKPNKVQLEFTPTDKNKQCIAPSPPSQPLSLQHSFPQLLKLHQTFPSCQKCRTFLFLNLGTVTS
ncbi:hypothetical protein Syun_018443 [Stephania yunnanensis]|uniref:HTH myb-type domain-containing protein n=1 Tax=Stephania yunnanensis TaxID=152371 RepID=A0AAP0IUJ7_9MAGN